MQEMILIKLGEIALKGLNKHTFEDVLVRNLRRSIAPFGHAKILNAQSTLYIMPQDADFDMDGATEAVGKVFGIVQYSRAAQVEKDFGKVTFLDSLFEGECGFVTEAMPEKTFFEKAKAAGNVISRIRMDA